MPANPIRMKLVRHGLSLLLLQTVLTSLAWSQGRTATRQTIEVDGLSRSYRLYAPARLATQPLVPVVLAFHGGGSEGAAMEKLTQFDELAEQEGFLVVYPDGIAKHWNDGRVPTHSAPENKQTADDVLFVSALLDELGKRYQIDEKRIFATGISNGGIFSHYLAARLADRIAAIAPVAGGLAESYRGQFMPAEPVSVCIMQGVDDPIVPIEGGEVRFGGRGNVLPTVQTLRLWVAQDSCKGPLKTTSLPDTDPSDGCRVKLQQWANGANGAEVVYYRMEGGGHTWPGGAQYLPKLIVGPVCRDVEATAVIWQFFKTHPKR